MDGEAPTSRKYDLEERLLDYAARIIELADTIADSKSARHVSAQLLRSGTAPLGMHGEAQAAESPRDFVHKMSLALKELRESLRWIRLICRSRLHSNEKLVTTLLDESDQLIRIFKTSIQTAQRRLE